jgi:hypothetical protein
MDKIGVVEGGITPLLGGYKSIERVMITVKLIVHAQGNNTPIAVYLPLCSIAGYHTHIISSENISLMAYLGCGNKSKYK